jgi:hypothetical protein
MPEHRSRSKLESAADAVGSLAVVAFAEVVASDAYDHLILEVTCRPHCERVPPAVCRRLADFDCGLKDVSTQGAGATKTYCIDAY